MDEIWYNRLWSPAVTCSVLELVFPGAQSWLRVLCKIRQKKQQRWRWRDEVLSLSSERKACVPAGAGSLAVSGTPPAAPSASSSSRSSALSSRCPCLTPETCSCCSVAAPACRGQTAAHIVLSRLSWQWQHSGTMNRSKLQRPLYLLCCAVRKLLVKSRSALDK